MMPADALPLVTQLRGRFDAPLILGVIETESSFNERAFRNDRNGGSYGLMQLDVPTARDRGFTGAPADLYDPAVNIRLGVAQLAWIDAYLRARSMAGLSNTVAAYNEGVGNVVRGNPDPGYVHRVLSARAGWQRRLGTGVA
jgi:soluble lytic murein transglycosylase-like protein